MFLQGASVTYSPQSSTFASITWAKLVQDSGYGFIYNGSRWSTGVDIADIPEEHWVQVGAMYVEDEADHRIYSIDSDGGAYVSLRKGLVGKVNNVHYNIVAENRALQERLVKEITARTPEAIIPLTADVMVKFWCDSHTGPTARAEWLQCPGWDEVNRNYSPRCHDRVQDIMSFQPPYDGGRLILWHGPPGTGKSTSIRSLIRSWAPWCDAHYIVDPEAFFGRSKYMMDVLFASSGHGQVQVDDPEMFALQGTERWRVLIVEDADEFMRHDAKQARGQSVARLLNVADGLIGQGRKFLILITTNEPMQNIHEAVARPGRCLANVEFPKFSHEESVSWMDKHDAVLRPPFASTYSLADLYDQIRERQQIRTQHEESRVGQYL